MAKWAGCVLVLICSAAGIARAEATADEGRAAIANLDWDTAIKYYQPLAANAKVGTPEWTQATFCLAVAQQQVQPASGDTIGTAEQLYRSIIDQSNDQRYVARSLMNLGRIAELRDYTGDKIDLATARKFYAQVAEKYANDPIGSEAKLREAAAFVMEYDAPDFKLARQGPPLLEKWLAEHPNDPLAAPMWQTAGDAYFMPLEDWKNALRCYEQVNRIGWVDPANSAPWFWRCARIAEKLGENKTAVKYYTKIINEAPNSGKGYASVLALKRLGAPVPNNPLLADPATQPAAAPATQEARP